LIVTLWLSLEKRTSDRELTNAYLTLQQAVAGRNRLEQAFTFLNQPETRQVTFGQGQPAMPGGNFFVNPRMGVLLVASSLPVLPAGKTYEMWVIPKRGARRSAGLFQSAPQGTTMHILPGVVDSNRDSGRHTRARIGLSRADVERSFLRQVLTPKGFPLDTPPIPGSI